jgi:integrase/recombinase XerD
LNFSRLVTNCSLFVHKIITVYSHELSTNYAHMTITRVLDKRRLTTSGENKDRFQIKIRLTKTEDKRTIQKLFQTGIYATPDEFKKIIGNPGKDRDLQEKQSKLSELYENGKQILEDNPFVDFGSFESELYQLGKYKNPLSIMEAYALERERAGKIGTRDYYNQATASFKAFAKDQKLVISFQSVTPELLMRYEKWMTGQGRSITTVGMYCIAMRTAFNIARSKHKISDKLYPFGRGKYVIPTSKGRKLALSEEQKNKVLSFRSLVPAVQKAVDLFIFSYFCYGMNFKDIALLKFRDIKDDAIIFDRAKTMDTERNKEFIEIPLRDETKQIIKRWGNFKESMNPSAYVFPVLRDGLTPEQVQERVHHFVKETNIGLVDLARHLGLHSITTYWARHTFATIAWKKGADLMFLQRALGHSDPKTTQRYLDSFDIETKRKVANWL